MYQCRCNVPIRVSVRMCTDSHVYQYQHQKIIRCCAEVSFVTINTLYILMHIRVQENVKCTHLNDRSYLKFGAE